MHQIKSIIRKATRNTDSYNVLTWATHERMQSLMGDSRHRFFVLHSSSNKNFKTWNENYAEIPDNHTMLREFTNEHDILLPLWLDIDVVISHSKFGQFQFSKQIAKLIGCPLISVEHTLPHPKWKKHVVVNYNMMRGNVNVFVSEYQKKAWLFEDCDNAIVIHSGVDEEKFAPDDNTEKDGTVLSICNSWVNRDVWCGFYLWKETTGYGRLKTHFPIKVIGDNPGLSKPCESVDLLVKEYQKSSVFLNTTLKSSMPTVILEAMACGLPIVSTGTCDIDKTLVKHEENGFIGDTPNELRKYCMILLNDKELANKMGKKSREIVLEKFTKKQYCDKWNKLISKTVEEYS